MSYHRAAGAHVVLDLVTLDGTLVRSIADGPEDAGEHRHEILADDAEPEAASGTLLVRLSVNGHVFTSGIVLLNRNDG